jgi:hypothetical protein
MSSTTPRRSRPLTLAETTIRRCTFSREISVGPTSSRIVASILSGTRAPDRRVDDGVADRLEVGALIVR